MVKSVSTEASSVDLEVLLVPMEVLVPMVLLEVLLVPSVLSEVLLVPLVELSAPTVELLELMVFHPTEVV
jgi:hypothetical protein